VGLCNNDEHGSKVVCEYTQKKAHGAWRMAHANHDVHLLSRTIQEWLPQGIQSGQDHE